MSAREDGPDISGDEVAAHKLRLRDPDLLDDGKGLRPVAKMCAKSNKPEFRCQTEMEFLTEEQAIALKLPADTRMALHKCVRPGSMEGAFTPVTSAEDALTVANDYCKCVRKVDPPAPPAPKVPRATLDARRAYCARKKS